MIDQLNDTIPDFEWCVALYDMNDGLLFTEIVRGIDYRHALDAARELWSHGDQDQLARPVRFTVQKIPHRE